MGLSLSLSNALGSTLNQGVPEFITVNGVLATLLRDANNEPLQDENYEYLYVAVEA